jgi:hypothetical protein
MIDKKRRSAASFTPLIVATLANYAAQVPYYIHNDYSPAHPLPGLRAVLLLGATLAWFAIGLAGFTRNRRWGFGVLISFLITEAFFYAISIASGAFIFQLENPSILLRAVYAIGYASGAVAAYYAYILIRERRQPATGTRLPGGEKAARRSRGREHDIA